MTRYDYKHNRPSNSAHLPGQGGLLGSLSVTGITNLLAGLLVGVLAALYFAWQVMPLQIVDNQPRSLAPAFREDFVLLVAETFAIEQDVERARTRLASLAGASGPAVVAQQTEKMMVTGAGSSDVKFMAQLAAALGVATPAMQNYLP
ncbi:MAG: hypothetical protein DWI63_01730 [Chloroflexi bacterium]|nr:MAG: hypothetical protein DWI62_03060 [Chloroflexota bacterium]RLT46825.1 MAG: hypothetical protein DWI63_01730 [Chloroflexota bacterium]